MAGLPLTITDAGRAALINAQNNGSVTLTINEVGVSQVHTAGSLTALTTLPNELKRLATFAGDVVADDTLHVTIRDETADTYSLRKFGLYLSNGVLFAVYSQSTTILEKSASAMVLLAADVALKSLTTANITFGATTFINPPATVDTPGVVELADQAETDAGLRSDVAVVPSRLKVRLDALMTTLNGLLAGKSNVGHTHPAADIVSGVLDVLRIPDLAMTKITGLAAAFALKLDITSFTWANLPGKPAVAVSNTDVVFNSVQVVQTGTPVVGLFYMGNQSGGSRTIRYDGTAYYFSGAPIFANGFRVQTTDDTASAATAGKIALRDASGDLFARNVVVTDAFGLQSAAGRRFYSEDAFGWTNRGTDAAISRINMRTSDGTLRGAVYTDNAGNIGFTDGAGSWRLRTSATGAVLNIANVDRTIWHTGNFDPALKLDVASFSYAGLPGKPDLVVNGQGVIQSGGGGNGYALIAGGNASVTGIVGFYAGNGTRFGWIGQANNVDKVINVVSENGGSWRFDSRPSFAGATPWDTANLSPVSLGGAQVITGRKVAKGNVAGNIATQSWQDSAFEVQSNANGAAAVMTWHIPGDVVFKFGLDVDHNWKAVTDGGLATFWHSLNFDPATKATLGSAASFYSVQAVEGGVGGRVLLGNQAGGARELVYNGVNYYLNGADLYANGSKAWTAATFDPATKANASHTHTAAQITDLLDVVWPAGQLHLFDAATVPNSARCLVANGATVSRTTYARLFAVIGTRYGAGDGATTFQIPDWRGVFFRGLDQGRGLDTGRALGVLQMSQNLQHNHNVNVRTNANTGIGFVEDADASGDARTVGTTFEGGDEARPINQALLACISY